MPITPIKARKSARAALELLDLDPATLAVRDQARADATPDDELIASVQQFGIMQPPTVEWDQDDEKYFIVMGHRRVGAAIAAGLNPITVILRTSDALADEAITLERQIVENERRKALTASDIARGYTKLELFGRTPEDIAAEIGEKPEKVRAGLRVAASAKTSTLIDAETSIDLEQAAIIAEFDEHPKLQERLITTATQRPANFTNEVHSVRKELELTEKLAEIKRAAKDAGVKIAETLSYDGGSYWTGRDGLGIVIDRLANVHGEPMQATDHTGCPGEAILITGSWHVDNLKTLNVCTDWEGNGHTKHTIAVAPREKTPEEIERDAEWARQNAERQQRAQALEVNSKARREWLRGFITGRLNQTAGVFDLIAAATIGASRLDELDVYGLEHIALFILTGDENYAAWDGRAADKLAQMITTGEVAALRGLVAHALSVSEYYLHSPDMAKAAPHLATTYTDRLTAWGYELTDIDIEIRDAATAALAEEDEATA